MKNHLKLIEQFHSRLFDVMVRAARQVARSGLIFYQISVECGIQEFCPSSILGFISNQSLDLMDEPRCPGPGSRRGFACLSILPPSSNSASLPTISPSLQTRHSPTFLELVRAHSVNCGAICRYKCIM